MNYLRTVWVLDVFDYLTHIDQALDALVLRYGWLGEISRTDLHGDWTDIIRLQEEREHKTRRDYLIDWIIREEIHEAHYIQTNQHHRNAEFMKIHHELLHHFDLRQHTYNCLLMPTFYGDIFPVSIRRQTCWLYIESYLPKIFI